MATTGNIDYKTLYRKYETTSEDMCVDHVEILDDYMRDSLRYTGPDRPFLAEDNIRHDHQSQTRINLRQFGDKSKSTPYAPDLFLGFTERDNRGTAVEPDFKQFRTHALARNNDYKYSFKDDSDHTVSETMITDHEIINNRKVGFNKIKNNLKIFNTSVGAWSHGYNQIKTKTSDVAKTRYDGIVPDLQNVNIRNKTDATTYLSNHIPIGWNTRTDHKFKVAEYGINTLSQQNIHYNDYLKNRFDTEVENKRLYLYNDNIVSKALIVLVDDLKKRKKDKYRPGLNDIKFRSSSELDNKKIQNSFEKNKEFELVQQTQKIKQELIDNINKKQKDKNTKLNLINNIRNSQKETKPSQEVTIKKYLTNEVLNSWLKSSQERNKTDSSQKKYRDSQLMNNSCSRFNFKKYFNQVFQSKEAVENKTFNKYSTDLKNNFNNKSNKGQMNKLHYKNYKNDMEFMDDKFIKSGIGQSIGNKYTNRYVEQDVEYGEINDKETLLFQRI
jgi:hypothetical protein